MWRKYLEAWLDDEKIWHWSRHNKKILHSNPTNVGVQHDFYKPKYLSQYEIHLIKKVFIDQLPDNEIKKLNMGWLNMFELISKIKRFTDGQDTDKKEIEQLNTFLHNCIENFYTKMENSAWIYLESIMREDLSFFDRDEDHINFLSFICFQYCRTKKFRDSVISATEDFRPIIDTKKIIDFISFFGATNVGASIYREKGLWQLVLLRNQSNIPFITCDQPVMNTLAYGKSPENPVEDLELFYPITPELAVLLTQKEYSNTDRLKMKEMMVDTYNVLAVDASHEQIYSNQEQILKDLLPFIR